MTGNGYQRKVKPLRPTGSRPSRRSAREPSSRTISARLRGDLCDAEEVEADRFYAEPTLRDFEWYLRTCEHHAADFVYNLPPVLIFATVLAPWVRRRCCCIFCFC